MWLQPNSSNHLVYRYILVWVPALGQASVPALGQVSVRALVPALGQASVPASGQELCRTGPLRSCTQRAEQAQGCGCPLCQAVVLQASQFRTRQRIQDKMTLEP